MPQPAARSPEPEPTTTSPLWFGRSTDAPDHAWLAEDPADVTDVTGIPPVVEKPTPDPPARPDRPTWRRALPVLAAALVLLAAGAALALALGSGRGSDSVRTVTAPTVISGRSPATAVSAIYAAASAGVVQVRAGSASGTGFVVDADGTIVTNAHVVDGASDARVRFDHDNLVDARIVGVDQSTDLAVLRVDPTKVDRLHPLALANSDQVRVGDLAVAIGYPLGLDRTATAGIVSGLGRDIKAPNGFTIDKVIQTDAPLNPGNSGGPLLDARGRVIGVNSQVATGARGNSGLGFAVPSNTVREVIPRLERGQAIRRAYLGVSTAPTLGGSGASVEEVTPGGPADGAGLRPGGQDVIVGIDGQAVSSPSDLVTAVEGYKPGDRVRLEVLRDGRRETVVVELGERPDRIP
jgi:putative serine protease PepD